MMIDAHCHFFTRSVITDSLTRLENTITRLDKIAERRNSGERKEMKLESLGSNTIKFLNTAVENTPLEMYNIMKDSYDCEFIAVPLMLDLSYTFLAPKNEVYENRKSFANTIKDISEKSRDKIKSKKWQRFTESFEETMGKFDRSVIGIDVFTESYEDQITDFIQLKKQLPDKVFPFFSIDPRRDETIDGGILSEIKRYVGKDKPFLGFKLYTSLGYSPTHPALFDNDGKESVYGYCEANNIPITIHSSLEGFSHMLDENYVEGDIYYPDAGFPVPAEDLYENGFIKYQKKFSSLYFSELTSERLLMLNHPILWKRVLERYPNLKLNMAHFGGIIQMSKYVKGNQTGFWPKIIIELMETYPNVFADLSCYYNKDKNPDYMKEFYENVYLKLPQVVKDKVMYGSDYFMITLFDTKLSSYIETFREAFGKDFKLISEVNPRKFLGI